jgi:hypothetical protein
VKTKPPVYFVWVTQEGGSYGTQSVRYFKEITTTESMQGSELYGFRTVLNGRQPR